MAISHFPSEQAAKSHLVTKGFEYSERGDIWSNRAAQVDARLQYSVHRGFYVYFFDATPKFPAHLRKYL